MSPRHSFLQLQLLPCEGDECASSEEASDFFDSHILVGYASNTFVDKTMFGEHSDPIITLKEVIFYE